MAQPTFPVDTNCIRIVSGGSAEPVMQWDRSGEKARRTENPERDEKTGLPLWDVKVSALVPNADGVEEMSEWMVRLPSAENPAQPVLSEVRLSGVIATVTFRGDVRFSADGIEPKGGAQK